MKPEGWRLGRLEVVEDKSLWVVEGGKQGVITGGEAGE